MHTVKLFQVFLSNHKNLCSVGLGCRILLLYRGVRPPPPTYECPVYDTQQFDSEVSVILELWGMRSTSSLPSLQGPLWLEVLTPYRVLSMGQIELNRTLMQNWIDEIELFWHLNCVLTLNWIVWNRTDYLYKNGFGIK